MIYNFSIDLSKINDLPESCFYESPRTGRRYLNCAIETFQRKDQYGNDAAIYSSEAFEDKDGNKRYEKKYLGNGKSINYQKRENAAKPDTAPNPSPSSSSDMPF